LSNICIDSFPGLQANSPFHGGRLLRLARFDVQRTSPVRLRYKSTPIACKAEHTAAKVSEMKKD